MGTQYVPQHRKEYHERCRLMPLFIRKSRKRRSLSAAFGVASGVRVALVALIAWMASCEPCFEIGSSLLVFSRCLFFAWKGASPYAKTKTSDSHSPSGSAVRLTGGGCGQQESGMELSVCVGGSYSTLDPIYAEDIPSQTVLVHLYENLMRVVADQAGNSNVVNGMAKSVETEKNADGTVTCRFRSAAPSGLTGKR